MLGIKDLIYRYRHNRGFGVQSPSAFHFVTSVLREKHSYYAYYSIEKIAGRKASHYKRLFRITNYLQPQSILLAAPKEAAKYAITAARTSATTIVAEAGCNPTTLFNKTGKPDMLYVGECENYAAIVEEAIKHTSQQSAIIIEGIHSSGNKREWWQRIKQNPAVYVTYDLYSLGILFFDKKYKKQHYTLKM